MINVKKIQTRVRRFKYKIKARKLYIAFLFVLLPIIVLSLIVFFFSSRSMVQKTEAAADATLSFSPTSRSINVGDSTTFDATVNPGSHQVSSTSLRITYDQTKVSLTNIACSGTFGTTLYGPIIPSPEDGTARIDCGVPLGNPPVTSTTTVATFTFSGVASATNSPLAFTSSSNVGADDEPGVNELGTRNGATVTVVNIDTTPPSFTINDGASGSYVQTDTINVSVSDASGVASRFYGFSTDSTCNASDTITTAFTSGTNFSITGNHSDYLCVKATDSSSNNNVGYQTVGQLHTDNTAPSFTVNDGTSSTSVKNDTINVTVADSASGVVSMYYGYSTDSTCNASDTISTVFTSGSNFIIAGNHSDYLCLKATDNSTNIGYQLVGQLHTDNTSPTVSQVTAVTGTGYDTTPDYTFNTTESGSIEYGGDCSSGTNNATVNHNTVTFIALSVGAHSNCTIRVTDAAGNQSNSLSVNSFSVTYRTDLNLDHSVDNLDYTFLHTYYGTANSTADINGDGVVDNLDYTSLHASYNNSF
jgi:large repetitive protein